MKKKIDEFDAAREIAAIFRKLSNLDKCDLALKWAKEVVGINDD